MNMKEYKFAVPSKENLKEKGFMSEYHIMVNGVNCYTGESEADYIAKGYTILTESEFDKLIEEYENSICGEWFEITEEFYNQQLNVLPPMRYYNGGFYISEAYTGSIHGFYQELNGKYYTSLQSTATNRDEIISELKAAIQSNQIEDRTKDED